MKKDRGKERKKREKKKKRKKKKREGGLQGRQQHPVANHRADPPSPLFFSLLPAGAPWAEAGRKEKNRGEGGSIPCAAFAPPFLRTPGRHPTRKKLAVVPPPTASSKWDLEITSASATAIAQGTANATRPKTNAKNNASANARSNANTSANTTANAKEEKAGNQIINRNSQSKSNKQSR